MPSKPTWDDISEQFTVLSFQQNCKLRKIDYPMGERVI